MTDLVPLDRTGSVTLRGIELTLAALADQASALAEARDSDELALWLAQARQLKRIVGDLERHIEDVLSPLLPYGASEVAGLGAVEVRRARDRKAWDWPALLDAMWPKLAERAEGDMGAMVTDLLNVIGLTGSKGPRVTPLRELGLDPDEFCESAPGRLTVTVPKVES